MRSSLALHHLAAAVLALGLSACCSSERESSEFDYDDPISGETLADVVDQNRTDAERCEAACAALVDRDILFATVEVDTCSAVGDVLEDEPWAPSNSQVVVTCSGTATERGGFCTGRRPQGHHESRRVVDSIGSWLAVHAHLEAASVTAFVELADWLSRRGAPPALVSRCRAAANDEVDHAAMMGRLARYHGASVEPVRADSPGDDLLEVALHNAVEGCVHEAFAAVTAAFQSRRAHAPSMRRVFARIAEDELRHGQLAWDVHAWLLDRLGSAERCQVLRAQRAALEKLPSIAAESARRTPAPLGWPSPDTAAAMAQAFGEHLHGRTATPQVH